MVAAVVSYQHGYEVVRAHGETGPEARLVPLTVDGLIYASSMVLLHSARRGLPVPALARWLLGVGITATLAANVAHGWAHGPIGAAVAAWLAVALVGSYELLMWLIRTPAVPMSREDELEEDTAEQAGTEHGPVAHLARNTGPGSKLDPDQAIQAYRASTKTGAPLLERKLAEQFRKSRRWARKIIAHVREHPTCTETEKGEELHTATP